MRGSFSKIVKNNKSNLIKIICVLIGAVFAFTTGFVYASFAGWKKSFDSGYATGAYLPNQSYQIINDTMPNGIPYNAGVNDQEVALQYSYAYNFEFYVEYALEWSNNNPITETTTDPTTGATTTTTLEKDSSNVILNYSNRDAWIVDGSHMYYREIVSAGTGKIPMIVGVNFTDLYDETYYGESLTINITKVVIKPVNENYSTSHPLYTDSTAGNAWLKYKTRTSLTNAYVVCYNQTSIGSYKPTAPVGETAFMTYNTTEGSTTTATRRLLGNRGYVGLGIYIITGRNAITLRAKVTGTWNPKTTDTVNIVSNTIKYNYSDNWVNETYNPASQTTNEIDEIREYAYEIPAYTAVYIPVVDSVEMVTRGLNTEADYAGAEISTLLELNTNQINTENGIGVKDNVASAGLSGKTALTTNETTVVNVSKYMPALFHTTDTNASRTYQTQITVINNTNKKLKVTANNFKLKLFISNGNSAAKYGQVYQFNDAVHWARAEVDSTALTVENSTKIVSPYGAVTLCTEFEISSSVYNNLITTNSKYGNCDLWAVLVPTITAVETTEADDTLTLETEIVTSGSTKTAYFYAKNVSTNVLSNIKLSVQYSWFNTQATEAQSQVGTSEPANWGREYWRYYTKTGSTFNQVTTSNFKNIPTWNTASTYYLFAGWQTVTSSITFTLSTGVNVNPSEKVLIGSLALKNSQTYNFNNHTFSFTTTNAINTTADDVQLINEASGLAYLINNSTTKSYYVRFNGTTSSTLFYSTAGYSYYKGLIRPGQVIPVPMTAVSDDIVIGSENFIEDTTGSLLSKTEIQSKGWASSFYDELTNLYTTIN